MPKKLNFYVSALASAALIAGLGGASVASGNEDEVDTTEYGQCTTAYRSVSTIPVDVSRLASSKIVTLDGWSVNVAADNWRAQHPTNPSLSQAYYSFGWLIGPDSKPIPGALDMFIEQARKNPDTTTSVPKDQMLAAGWSESASVLRLKTALCLYLEFPSAADRQRLAPAMDQLLFAVKDSKRYYGPPKMRAHNHGVMADRELLNAARILERPDLAAYAVKRLKAQMKGLYDTCGFTYEQSSSYQHFHGNLWSQISRRVGDLDPAFKSLVDKKIEQIYEAARWVTYPDGNSPVIGDGKMKRVDDLASVSQDLREICRSSGWFSWRDTSATGVRQQVIARFGPTTALHGHADKGSVNWWVQRPGATGVQVLSDRGLPGKNRDAAYEYATGPEAHAVLLWPGGSDLKMSGVLRTDRRTGAEVLRMRGSKSKLGSWLRVVTMSPDSLSMKFEDRVYGKVAGAQPATQLFPLDPAWSSAGRPGVYRTAGGDTLTISCNTIKGDAGKLSEKTVPDYQLEAGNVRDAITVMCSAPQGSLGLVSSLSVS